MFHSEMGQDRWLDEYVFRGMEGGVFFEAGALDGVLDSNTLFFEEDRGWSGILVEANPILGNHLLRVRPRCICMNVALWDVSGEVEFQQVNSGLYGWSGVIESFADEAKKRMSHLPEREKRVIKIPAITLNDALDKACIFHIDYMSLDLEGAEWTVLKGFNFQRYDVDVFGIEDNGDIEKIDALLKAKGYYHLARVGQDEFWRKER